jgi:hypothetical protein
MPYQNRPSSGSSWFQFTEELEVRKDGFGEGLPSRDRKSLNLPEKERVSDCWPRPKALAMGHYSRRRGEM